MLIPPGNSGHGMKWQLWISLEDAQVEGVAVDFSHPQLVSVWDCCCFFPCFLTQKSGFGIAGFCCYKIQDALQRATFDSNSQVGAIFQILHTKESPPTYFRTNKFTSSFQEIVDAYGCCKMRNPLFFVD